MDRRKDFQERVEDVVFLSEMLTSTKIKEYIAGRNYMVLVDRNVSRLYSELFDNLIVYELPEGEMAKTLMVYEDVVKALGKHQFTRNGVIVAIGGGSVSDLAGFVASTYMRGVDLINIPTTLLAMCDAAIGGKNALNVSAKNELGTFYSASTVVIDVNFLSTLPIEAMKSGAGELLKYAVGFEPGMLDMLKNSTYDNVNTFLALIRHAIWIKKDVVARDFRDGSVRKTLNFGHTLAHAVEFASNFGISHGEAVAIGVYHMVKWAEREKKLGIEEVMKIEEVYDYLGLPRYIPKKFTRASVVAPISSDKKSLGSEIDIVKITEFGRLNLERMSIQSFVESIFNIAETMYSGKDVVQKDLVNGDVEQVNRGAVSIPIPASKSYAHRFLILAAFAETPTIIRCFEGSEDLSATMQALEIMTGVTFEFLDDRSTLRVLPSGISSNEAETKSADVNTLRSVNFGESGSSARFLIPFVGIKNSCPIQFCGEPSLERRPMNTILEILRAQGLLVSDNERGTLPFTVDGRIKSGVFRPSGEISSQFVSGLLMAAPQFDGKSKIVLSEKQVSMPYIEMTFDAMKQMGVALKEQDGAYIVNPSSYQVGEPIVVERDYSQAAFWIVAELLRQEELNRDFLSVAENGLSLSGETLNDSALTEGQGSTPRLPEILIPGLNPESLQADRDLLSILGVTLNASGQVVRIHPAERRIDISRCPDVFPILAVYYSLRGGAEILGAERLAYKESDRYVAMKEELERLGGKMEKIDGVVRIVQKPLFGGRVTAHGDHRVAMALYILSLFVDGIVVEGSDCIKKSYPTFLEHLAWVREGKEIG